MRIIATSDTHYPVKDISFVPDGDVFIHAGDLMQNGYPNEWYPCLEWLEALPHKKKYYIPGNHDFHMMNYPGPALQNLRKIGVTVVGLPDNPNYRKITLDNNMTMIGLPFVRNLPKWAFNVTGDFIHWWLVNTGKADIVVSHCPIEGVLAGDKSLHHGIPHYNEYIRERKPKIWIHGHVHEDYGTAEYRGCKIYNVAMCNSDYKQVNPPMIIDV